MKLLDFIDKTVPEGSHLVMLGLGDGDVLYDNLHADIHPLNVTYGNVYDFLNCLEISPCWGWLNSNETVRKFTTERAKNLSKVYNEILKEQLNTLSDYVAILHDNYIGYYRNGFLISTDSISRYSLPIKN